MIGAGGRLVGVDEPEPAARLGDRILVDLPDGQTRALPRREHPGRRHDPGDPSTPSSSTDSPVSRGPGSPVVLQPSIVYRR
jgi:hypothetical protein